MRQFLLIICALASVGIFGTQAKEYQLTLNENLVGNGSCTLDVETGTYIYRVTAPPLNAYTHPFVEDVPTDADSLAFEYSCVSTPTPNVLQVWFGKFTSAGFVFADGGGNPTQKIYTSPLNPTSSDEFVTYKVNVAAERADYPYFGEKNNLCFLSFYYPAGTLIKVRNLRLYDKPDTGVKTVGAGSKFTAVGSNGAITVSAPASIYNLAGSLVGTTYANISVPAGLYLVKSGTSTLKVLVK